MRIHSFIAKLFALGALLGLRDLNAQDLGVLSNNTMIAVPVSGNTTTGTLNFTTPCSDFKVREGKVWVKLDLGEQYRFGSATAGFLFDIEVNLDLTLATSGGTDPTINFTVNLNNQNPEGLVFLDLAQYLDDTDTVSGLSHLSETINAVTATINSAVDTTNAIDLQVNLNIGLHSELAYGLEVANTTVDLISNTVTPNSKVVLFEWAASCDAPNYEFQLLRLFNKDASFLTDERHIRTDLDWTKALSFQTYGPDKQLLLTIGEGQGFYVWRVRPIGTFHENGPGNDLNWGSWNSSIYNAGMHEFTAPTASVESFFFEDPDDKANYQYSRVFTEGNKISEQATYATTLNQVKQTQRYFPSKNYKIISQTILDNSGRPTLTTLPVPVEGERIASYKNNFVTTNGDLYRAKHFDLSSNYANPSTIDATGAFAYYSSLNSDKRVPSAEGYPYTRVIFSNDGTDRVVEQSGVGKTHMLGDQAAGQGRTVRTLYGTPTEEELVALFGDEAPDPEQTAKVITIDPNNTKSVAYITKEGNTIATGLTFSEDQAVLDRIDTGAVVFGRTDKITNNTATDKGFKASKRITVLEDATDIQIGYTIAKPVLEGLCNNLELEMDYALNIQIFDVETGLVVREFHEESIIGFLASPSDTDITIDFGTVSLDTGTYYIQKNLVPADDITAKLVTSTENSRRLIEPFFGWLVDALDEIDCEAEMQVLYNDIFFYGKTVFQQGLSQNNGLLQFNCTGCSEVEYQFLTKNPADPEAPAEFLDYYANNEASYHIDIVYVDSNGDFQLINFAQTSSLGTIKPVEVRFTTPCCQFNIPIVFTPPFRKPTPEALSAYVNNTAAVQKLNGSTDYFNPALLDTVTPPVSGLAPNYRFLTEESNNFQYEQDGSDVTLVNSDAYPLDFEGYAISMLYECKNSVDPAYSRTDAQNDIYNAMRGWHGPGLFNQMVYHMATDDYGSVGCANRHDGTDGGNTDPGPGGDPNVPEDKYHTCDIEAAGAKLAGAQYSVDELARCWEPLVIELVNQLCVQSYEADIDQDSNVAKNVDVQDGEAVNEAVKGIKNFIIRWISRGKIKRKMRKKNVGVTENIADEVQKLSGNLVKKFLDCTGYTFADILDPTERPTDYPEFAADFNLTETDGEYDHERLLHNGIGANWAYFSIDPNDPMDTYQAPPTDPTVVVPNILKDLFPNIEDPVYAFKYFAYLPGTFPILEVETCFKDPNICLDQNGNEVPCCGGTLAEPVPCNFCGLGYITCPYSKDSWSCNQRFTFFEMIKNYSEVVEPDGIAVTCENYYEATSFAINPDYGKLLGVDDVTGEETTEADFVLQYTNVDMPADALSDFPYLSDLLVTEFLNNNFADFTPVSLNDINGNSQTSGVSIIENDAYAMMEECTSNCDARRNEFREELIKAFTDRCYVIGECKIDPNDNIVPEEDIELMVDQMVAQCQSQCTISSYACSDEGCRLPTKSPYEYGGSPETSNDFNTSYIDFGVSGPIVSGFSTREDQTLRLINTTSGEIEDTNAPVTVQNISVAGTLNKYSYTTSPSIWDMRRSLTYAEYARWIQAMEWEIVLDIPSKCDANGNYDQTLTYNVDGLPNEPVYVRDDQGIWVAQNFAIAPSPYVSSTNPGGPGDTFVERELYLKTNTAPASPNDPSVTDPVDSPSVGITVEINNN